MTWNAGDNKTRANRRWYGAGVAGPAAAVGGVIVTARADRDGVIAGAEIEVVTDLTCKVQRDVAAGGVGDINIALFTAGGGGGLRKACPD